jgi:hypothetical protein
MCFSAGASFGAGLVLGALGVATMKQAKTPSDRMFGAIPFLFAIQQLCEGLLWLALSKPEYAQWYAFSTYSFLFFAKLLWPVWIPVSIFLMTPGEKRRLIQKILVGSGIMICLYMIYTLLTSDVESAIKGHHLVYTFNYPIKLGIYGTMIYLVTTVAPAFFARVKWMWLFGATILISYIVSYIFFKEYVLSVWCFFASLISVTVWVVLRDKVAGKAYKVYKAYEA